MCGDLGTGIGGQLLLLVPLGYNNYCLLQPTISSLKGIVWKLSLMTTCTWSKLKILPRCNAWVWINDLFLLNVFYLFLHPSPSSSPKQCRYLESSDDTGLGTLTFCDSLDRPGGYYAKGNKLSRERQTPYDLTYLWNLMDTINGWTKQNKGMDVGNHPAWFQKL